MKKYILSQDSTIINRNGEIVIKKGTEVVDTNNYIDEDGGVKVSVMTGEYKGKEIVFNIKELTEV